MKAIYSKILATFLMALLWNGSLSFLAIMTMPEAQAFGDDSDDDKDEEKDDCEKAKDKRDEKCDKYGDDSSKCEKEKEEAKEECKEDTDEEQAEEEEEKNEDASVTDTQALNSIDGNIAKIILIRDQANSAHSQLATIHSNLLTASKDPCVSAADFATKKAEAIVSASSLKSIGDSNVGSDIDMDASSISLLLNNITAEVGKVSEDYLSVAQNKQAVGQNYANEATNYINLFNKLKTLIENMPYAATGTCSASSSSSSAVSSSSSSSNVNGTVSATGSNTVNVGDE